jgi:hypothetical protein
MEPQGADRCAARGAAFMYDVFVSYSRHDGQWVHDVLVPRLEAARLRVCIDDRDFTPAAWSLLEMERAVLQSRKTLLVLTPHYLDSEWTIFESVLAQTLDPAASQRRMLTLLLEPCSLPLRLSALVYLSFTDSTRLDASFASLIGAVRRARTH